MFKPTKPQLKFKARAYREHPDVDFSSMTAREIERLTGCRSVSKWYADSEFVDWFINKDYTRQLLEAAAELAVERLTRIVECDNVGPRGEVTAAAQVAAAKTLLEMADYSPSKKKEIIFRDKDIDKMDEHELKEFVRQHLKLVGTTDAATE